MAVGGLAGGDVAGGEGDDLGVFGLGAEGRGDGAERAHPVERPPLPQRIDLAQGKPAMILRQDAGEDRRRGGALLLDVVAT